MTIYNSILSGVLITHSVSSFFNKHVYHGPDVVSTSHSKRSPLCEGILRKVLFDTTCILTRPLLAIAYLAINW